jgi:hypothetical protein
MARIDREQLGELLSGYIDGELDPRQRQIIERVLREDESARQLLADLQRTAQAVSSLPRHAAPASILGDTQATLERSALLDDFPEPRAHQTRGRSSWAARLAMAAMVGLVLVTGWWFTTEQTRRGSKGRTELARREVREAAPISVPADSRIALERWGDEFAVNDTVRSAGAAAATVEKQLAAGVDPTSFRSQTFAAEPVRLQVAVRDPTEREAVSTRIAAALSSQHLADLASAPGVGGDTTGSVQRFYYRGKAGINYDAADEDQILVRASPQQIDHLLTELSVPGSSDEAVALVAGPITVRGVEKSRSVVQLLGEQQQSGVPRSEMTRGDDLIFDKNGATVDADGTSADPSTAPSGGMLDGLLKIVGIDPKLLSSEAKSAAKTGDPTAESAAESESQDSSKDTVDAVPVAHAKKNRLTAKEAETPRTVGAKGKTAKSVSTNARELPPAPPPLVERRLREAVGSSRGLVGKDDRPRGGDESPEANVTVVVQIIERPTPVPPTKPVKRNPNRIDKSKTAE